VEMVVYSVDVVSKEMGSNRKDFIDSEARLPCFPCYTKVGRYLIVIHGGMCGAGMPGEDTYCGLFKCLYLSL
jgi:hypothetical protein